MWFSKIRISETYMQAYALGKIKIAMESKVSNDALLFIIISFFLVIRSFYRV